MLIDVQNITEQLWKMNSEGKLVNKRFQSNWEHYENVRVVPDENTSGHIEAINEEVLDIDMQKVIMKPKKALKQQTWHRSNSNQNGWFSLKNAKSGKFLTAESDGRIIVTGKLYV